jgi:hypothetical protein
VSGPCLGICIACCFLFYTHSAPTPDTVTADRFSVKVVDSLKDSEFNSDDWSTRNSEELDESFHGWLEKRTDWIHGGLEEYTDWDLNASLFAQFEFQKNKSNFGADSSAPGPSVNRNRLYVVSNISQRAPS